MRRRGPGWSWNNRTTEYGASNSAREPNRVGQNDAEKVFGEIGVVLLIVLASAAAIQVLFISL